MHDSAVNTLDPSTDDIVQSAKALLQTGNAIQACDLLNDSFESLQDHDEGLYVLAVSQRYSGKLESALQTLTLLKTLRPAYGRAWQEEGHVHLARRDKVSAKIAFKSAVARNNSLIASWSMLAELCIEDSDQTQYAEAAENTARLKALPPELLSVRNMISEKKLYLAERLCRRFLKSNPQNVEGMRLLADLGVRSQVLDDAEFLLESAVEFEPDNHFARFDYVNVLYRRQKYAQSLEQARLLRDADPENPNYCMAFANQCVAVGEYDEAMQIYDDLTSKAVNNPGLHLVHGHALKTVGRLDDAIQSYRRAYSDKPTFGDAYWSLANLKTYRFTHTEVAAMQAAEAESATDLDDKIHLCFALGKSFEDNADFAAAAEYYLRGNALKKDELGYDGEHMSRRLALQRTACTAQFFASAGNGGCKADDPIFIVGLPRAGSTLLEQILASHSQVDGTLELPNISALAHRLDGRRLKDDAPKYPGVLADISNEKFAQFGEAFIADTRIHRRGAAFFIDKMPNNFRHIGLIQRMLPNAKIIDARRHPMACCFSGFKQLFASGQEFTYGLEEIGRYYKDYVELMDHWDKVLPGKILHVHYEDVVADLEIQVRRILDYCELPFEAACLKFHETDRSVRTPSSEQVRQPIYKSGLEQWRQFEPYLGPLKDALGPVLERYRSDPATVQTNV